MQQDTKRILIVVILGIAVMIGICLGNYSYQSNELKKSRRDDFETKERAKGRGAHGGFLGITGGAMASLASYISEGVADRLSEMMFGTSGRKGKEYANRYKDNIEKLNKMKSTEAEKRKWYADLKAALDEEMRIAKMKGLSDRIQKINNAIESVDKEIELYDTILKLRKKAEITVKFGEISDPVNSGGRHIEAEKYIVNAEVFERTIELMNANNKQ